METSRDLPKNSSNRLEYVIDDFDVYEEEAVVRGNNNIIHSDGCYVYGNKNTFNGGACKSWGDENIFVGDGSEIFGKKNIIRGNYCIYHDKDNLVLGQECIYIGEEDEVKPVKRTIEEVDTDEEGEDEGSPKRTKSDTEEEDENPEPEVRPQYPPNYGMPIMYNPTSWPNNQLLNAGYHNNVWPLNPPLPSQAALDSLNSPQIIMANNVFGGSGVQLNIGSNSYSHHLAMGHGMVSHKTPLGTRYQFPNGGTLFIKNQRFDFEPSTEWLCFDKDDNRITNQEKPVEPEPIKKPGRRTICTLNRRYEPLFSEETDRRLCLVCYEKEISTVCKPCGHSAYCIGCSYASIDFWEEKQSDRLLPCPLCSKEVEEISKLL